MKPRDSKKKIQEFSIDEEFEEIGALFNQGLIKKLSRLEEHKPTNLSKKLQMGYNTYTERLRNPELFSIEDLIKLSKLVGTDYQIILRIVQKEIKEKYGV
ncbi:hypothetical protein FKX85_06615 [Echinicola soli]|uniref:HTH cro/C1-type domain-containing protein n=1 Tax=Echinicola soli TaxID=2591634 RepID=A0A514CFX1_9BACT|nr:hypothetical protein [Echinicola soli]QDH78725.1 hypothetical protein FKX85_06615 [Echinicola soli]